MTEAAAAAAATATAPDSPSKRARRSTLEESNKTKAGVLEWMSWTRDSSFRGGGGPAPVNRESVHSNLRQSWLALNNNNEKEEGGDVVTAATSKSSNGGLRLVPFGKDIWTVEGSVVDFYGFPYPTRMVVIHLTDGTSWIWSPIEIKEGEEGDDLVKEVEHTAGPVRHLVSPNKIHWLFIQQWQKKCPDAKTYASPGLKERKIAKDIPFDTVLTNTADPIYATDIDQLIFEGGILDEVVFFHKPSKTAIFCDLIMRHVESEFLNNCNNNKFKLWLMKADGIIGHKGGTPKEWRFSFWWYGLLEKARQQLTVVLEEWQPDKLIIAHGQNAHQDAVVVIDQCLSWIPKQPPKEKCCCFPTSSKSSTSEEEKVEETEATKE